MALLVPCRPPHYLRGSSAITRWAKSVTTENRPNSAGAVLLDRHLRPMPLRLEAQALADLLKRGLHLPAPHEPRDDPRRIGREVGAQQSLGLEVSSGSRINTQRNGTAGNPVEYQTAVSETISTVRSRHRTSWLP